MPGEIPTSTSAPKPNLALYVTQDHQIYQKETPYPVAGPDDCIVHVRATGICGSEIHFWKAGGIGDCLVTHDLILGHESAGIVLSVGSNVSTLAPGDRVSIEPGVACWECPKCVEGRYNLCPRVRFSGTPPTDGTLRRYVAHPARFLHKIPDSMSYAHAALIEPFSVAAGAVRRAAEATELGLGTPTLVCGAGPVGLATALCARRAGAEPVLVTDLEEGRLVQARGMGFLTLKVELTWDARELGRQIRAATAAATGGLEPRVAFECTGAGSSIQAACHALEDGGTLLQVGCGKPDVEIPLMAMGFREVNIVTSFRYKQTWPTLIRLFNAQFFGALDGLVTHVYPLERALDAFATAVDRSAGAVKIQIVDE